MKYRSTSIDAFFNLRVLFGVLLSSVGVFLALMALSINFSSTATAAGAKLNNGVKVIYSYHNDVSPAMRDVEAWPVQRLQEHEAAENPSILIPHVNKPDTVVQQTSLLGRLAPSIPAPILNFAGIPFPGVTCNCAPPDTNGEVGATQYVQMVNTGYQVFDKATGASVLGPNSIVSIWTGFGGVCQTNGFGDPVVLYDQLANRWVITQFAGLGIPQDECVAVSTTSDATGTYNRYAFHIGPNFFDYPHLSVWPDAYYMSANIFNSSGTAYLGPQAYALDRAKMLAGQPATLIAMPILGSSFPPMLPSDLDGSTLPPAGAPNPFVLWPSNNTYRIFHFHADFVVPGNSTFNLFASPPAANFTTLCPFTRACVPQQGQSISQGLDDIGDRLMFRLAYRNFGGHESLVGNYTVASGGVAGVRWFELRGVTGGPATTFQESTYQPDTTWRWMGSVAMDSQGNMALGYSASSSSILPQVRYTGRLVGDPLNTLPQGEATLHAGTGAQINTGNRWGDYSDMTVDPVDDQTFWYTTEYYDNTSSFNWRTRIGNFKLATGGGGANLLSAASRLTHGGAGAFNINMPLTGTSGVEDRSSSTYTAVFTFDTAVTSGSVTVLSGTATAGAPTFSGVEMRVPLTGVADIQVVTLRVSNVNGSGTTAGDVPFGFLTADVNENRTVDRPDQQQINADKNQAVNGTNFRDDINLSGTIDRPDLQLAKANRGNSLP